MSHDTFETMRRIRRSLVVGLGGVAAVVGLARSARAAAPACSALPTSVPIVYVENGDTQEPLMKRLGAQLIKSATRIRVIYKNRGTCDLANDMYNGTAITDDGTIKYIPTATEDPTWTPLSASPVCTLDPGTVPALAVGATFLSSCVFANPKPANLSVVNGPVQSYGFIVPLASSQIALTAQEGYFAYGFPADTGMATPWIDQALRYSRGATKSTALTTAAAMGLKASGLKGTIPAGNSSTEVLNLVATSSNPEPTIGIMGTEVYDGARNLVKLLAFKGFGQKYGYFPDSSSTSFDKKNVRDGHYLPWAPTPYITLVDAGTGKATDPNVQRMIDLVLGVRVDADVNGLDAVIASGLIPDCAMSVTRAFDGGDFSLYSPTQSCACYFESKVPQGSTKCSVCTTDAQCGAGKCHRGYCEVR
jgi:hypothetical protein